MSQPTVTNLQQNRPPELPIQPPSPISSIVPQPSESPSSPHRTLDGDSDDSLEIIETDSVRAQIDKDRPGQGIKDRYREESPHPPGTPRGRTKSRRPAILDSDSDDISEVIRPPQADAKRKLSLSPLRTFFPYQSMVAQDRALSAHPSNNSPYASRSSFPFLSTTSLKMSMSTSSFLKFPVTPTTPRNESFVSRKLSAFKGRERARSESLETWEVVESESPRTPTVDLLEDPATPTFPIQGQSRRSPVPNLSRPLLLESESNGAIETDTSRNNEETHPLSLRDRKAPPVPRVDRTVRRSAPLPPVQTVPPVTPTSPTSQMPVVSNVHNRLINSSPVAKKKKPQVVCASPLGANRWRTDEETDVPLPSNFQRALATPLPSTPVELTHSQLPDLLPVTVSTPTRQTTAFSSNKTGSQSQSPVYSLTTLSGATPSEGSDLFTFDRALLPPMGVARRPSTDSDTHSARHYPGRPLPRPPGSSRALVDSTYAGHEDFQVNGNTFSEGLLIDFGDTSLTESFTSRASTPQPDEGRYGSPIQLAAAPSTSSASSTELVESVQLPSQRDTSNLPPPAALSSAPGQFLEVTDLDVLVSRLHEEQQNGSDYEVSS
jgi:hypothetical protein